MHKQVLILAALLVCVALATSRFGLIAHELVGHGGTAVIAGARITEVRLFWFAGGWIRYELAVPSVPIALAIAMGGIAIELVCGIALWLAVRRACFRPLALRFGARILGGVGAALVVHASWYFATGAWHGFGDGVLLYRELGSARYPVAIAAGLVTCAAAFAGARVGLGALAATLPRRRIAGTIVAVVVAGGLCGALAIGELRLRRDVSYETTMQSERERTIAHDMARWDAEHPAAVAAARQREASRLESEHLLFPFAWLLGGVAALAAIAGARRSDALPFTPIPRRVLVTAAGLATIAICAVIAIGFALPM